MSKVIRLKSNREVVKQLVVLDAGLYRRFEKKVAELEMTKSLAIEIALSVWVNTYDKPEVK